MFPVRQLGINLLRNCGCKVKRNFSTTRKNLSDEVDGWRYRNVGPDPVPEPTDLFFLRAFSGFAWWWMLWHFYKEPGHVLGEFAWQEPSSWTDEELGIPPDDE